MHRLLILNVAVIGFAAQAQAAPIELVDPQDSANYVPVTLVATPLDAVRIVTDLPPLDTYEALVSATPPQTTFWLNRSNLRIQPQLRGWYFGWTTWHTTSQNYLDLRPEMNADAITLTVSTEPVNGDMELENGAVDRFWTVDGGAPRTFLMRAFITPEPSAGALAAWAGLVLAPRRSFNSRRTRRFS